MVAVTSVTAKVDYNISQSRASAIKGSTVLRRNASYHLVATSRLHIPLGGSDALLGSHRLSSQHLHSELHPDTRPAPA